MPGEDENHPTQEPRRILLTNLTLATRTGTETSTRDLALEFLRRGHQVAIFTPDPGPLADELAQAGVPVLADLNQLTEPPDLIHGHHNLPLLAALVRFPEAPAIYTCHDAQSWFDRAPLLPQIRRYAAVGGHTRDRLLADGVPAERVLLMLNFVDLARFPVRAPLPVRPQRALVFANQAREDTYLPAVRAACAAEGLALEVMGEGVGQAEADPGRRLGGFDVVFAKGKAAMEAMAVGCAAVLCDIEGLGPLVTSRNLDTLRPLNFGRPTMPDPVTADAVRARLRDYDAEDARRTSERIRAEASLTRAADLWCALHARVLAEHRAAPVSPAEARQAAAAGLGALSAYLYRYVHQTAYTASLRWLKPYQDTALDLARLRERTQWCGLGRLFRAVGRLGARLRPRSRPPSQD